MTAFWRNIFSMEQVILRDLLYGERFLFKEHVTYCKFFHTEILSESLRYRERGREEKRKLV